MKIMLIFKTFYFEIISDLQKIIKNNAEFAYALHLVVVDVKHRFVHTIRPARGAWALKREADLARPGRAGSCPERGSERQACARPRRAGRPPRLAAASAGLRRGFDLGSSPRPAVPNLVGTRDRRSQENLLPGDLGRAEEAMLGLGSGRKCR